MGYKVLGLGSLSLSKGAWFVSLTQSRKGSAKYAKKQESPRKLCVLRDSAVPILQSPSSLICE